MKERRLKISSVSRPGLGGRGDFVDVAMIRLSGNWLEKLGFEIGETFLLRTHCGRLELIADWVDSFEESELVK